MAIYHLNTQTISRSQGRSIVACAAYRSGQKLQDDRYDRCHDYTRKADVAHAEILCPTQAPAWMADRETLWNHIEALEKRKDARLAREVQMALPRELTVEQNKELARAFVQQTFVEAGMVADLCIHVDKGSDGVCQPHAHVLLTTRLVTKQGFGLKNTDWNKKEQLLEWRQAWANMANAHLAQHGHDVQIDHRSYKDQQIDLEPQHKKGHINGPQQEERVLDHQRIARENGEKLIQNPRLALDAITRQQSTFTPQDLARFVHRHSDTPEQFQQISNQIEACKDLVRLGTDDKGQERLTTRGMMECERRLLMQAQALQTGQGHNVAEKTVQQALSTRTLSTEQHDALCDLTAPGDLKCLIGAAGTGKSYLLSAAREAWEASSYRVRGVALSGMAAQSLQQGSGIDARTVASTFHSWDRDRNRLDTKDILVVDEAGLLGSRQMGRLIQEAHQAGAKVVLIGDPQQLQAIEAGAAFRALAQQMPTSELTDIRRQQVDWQKEATRNLAQGDVVKALHAYDTHDHLHRFERQDQAKQQLMTQWNDVRRTDPTQSQLLLAYTRVEVKDLNDRARALMRQEGDLDVDYRVDTDKGARDFAAGDRVSFLKRNNELNVINGTLGTIQAIDRRTKELTIKIDDHPARSVTVDPTLYNHLDHGYAATVYKAQGVTVDRSYLLASRCDDAHSTYVALSRHRQSCDVFVSREVFKEEGEMLSTLGRNRAKDVTLDYDPPEARYAAQRSFNLHPRLQNLQDLAQRFRDKTLAYGHVIQKKFEVMTHQREMAFDQRCCAFQATFRQKDPMMAQKIEHRVISPIQMQAEAYVQLSQTLAQVRHRHGLTDQQQQLFWQRTREIAASQPMMDYLQCHQPQMVKAIEGALQAEQRSKEQEQTLQQAHTHHRERSLERGFSR